MHKGKFLYGLPTYSRILLRDREQCEVELSAVHLCLGVLMPAFQPGESTDTHYHQPITSHQCHRRRLGRDLDRDPESALHHIDASLVAGVQAGHNALADHCLCLIDGELALSDRAGGGEHTGGDAETKIGCHII